MAVYTENFTGTDGTIPSGWAKRITDNAIGEATIEIQSNILEIEWPSGTDKDGYAGLYSTLYTLSGNFDVRVEYSNFVRTDGYIRQYLALNYSGGVIYTGRYESAAENEYYGVSTGQTTLKAVTTDTSGKFRVVRVGTTATFYYWDGASSWTSMGSLTCSTDAVEIELIAYHSSAVDTALIQRFDIFSIETGADHDIAGTSSIDFTMGDVAIVLGNANEIAGTSSLAFTMGSVVLDSAVELLCSISLEFTNVAELILSNNYTLIGDVEGYCEIDVNLVYTNSLLSTVLSAGDVSDSFAGAQYVIPTIDTVGAGEIPFAITIAYFPEDIVLGYGDVEIPITIVYSSLDNIASEGELTDTLTYGLNLLDEVISAGIFEDILSIAWYPEDIVEGYGELLSDAQVSFVINGIAEGYGEGADVITHVYVVGGSVEIELEIVAPVISSADNTTTFSVVVYGKQPQPVMFTKFDFNSFIEIGGKVYGANDSGISILGGDTDELDTVRSAIRFNKSVLGSSNTRKRVRSIHLGPYNKKASVKGITEKRELEVIADRTGKAIIGRYVYGRDYALEVKDFEELEHIDLYVTETN